jgi:hypothetical protein
MCRRISGENLIQGESAVHESPPTPASPPLQRCERFQAPRLNGCNGIAHESARSTATISLRLIAIHTPTRQALFRRFRAHRTEPDTSHGMVVAEWSINLTE